MLPIRTILHPTDFSGPSECAFRMACSLARDYGARLVLLHVRPYDVLFVEPYVLPLDPEEVWTELRQQLDRLRPPEPAPPVERLLKDGDPAEQILRTAERVKADLIVMGTHGRTGIGRLLMGSVAELVLRRAACPVLTVKTPFAADAPVGREEDVGQTVPS